MECHWRNTELGIEHSDATFGSAPSPTGDTAKPGPITSSVGSKMEVLVKFCVAHHPHLETPHWPLPRDPSFLFPFPIGQVLRAAPSLSGHPLLHLMVRMQLNIYDQPSCMGGQTCHNSCHATLPMCLAHQCLTLRVHLKWAQCLCFQVGKRMRPRGEEKLTPGILTDR